MSFNSSFGSHCHGLFSNWERSFSGKPRPWLNFDIQYLISILHWENIVWSLAGNQRIEKRCYKTCHTACSKSIISSLFQGCSISNAYHTKTAAAGAFLSFTLQRNVAVMFVFRLFLWWTELFTMDKGLSLATSFLQLSIFFSCGLRHPLLNKMV